MTSSGLRPPQFSEDIAWVPSWLQPHQEVQLDDHILDAQTPNTQSCKVQRNAVLEKDVDLCAREEAGFNNFRLLLSGTDNSPIGMTPSGNLLHFHLHLSSNGTSQYTPSPVFTAQQTVRGESNDITSMQLLPETSACPQDRTCPYEMEVENEMPNAQIISKPRISLRSRSPSLSKDGIICRKKNREKIDCKNLLNADFTNAVELSIAASEALVVSDIVNSGFGSEVLAASAVVEVALHVKQARNHLFPVTFGNISNCEAEVVDETHLLQNLDEDIMKDAYKDVGLSIKPADPMSEDPCCTRSVPNLKCSLSGTLSRVLDTPVSQNHYECDVKVQNVKLRSQEVEFDGTSNRTSEDALAVDSTSKDSSSESFLGVRQEKLSDDQHLVLDTLSAEMHVEPQFNQSVQANAELATNLEMNNGIDNESLSNTQQSVLASPHICKSRNDGAKEEFFSVVPDKFRSRWLGGWSGKDANYGLMDQDAVKRITKFVIRETSFISESANLFPDENSLVNKQEAAPIVASLSSVAFEGLCSTSKGIELSQDLMSSYNLSVVDPLCSVVPCSISSEDADVNVATNRKSLEEDADKCLTPTLENGLEDLQMRTTGSENGERNTLKTDCEESVAMTRRRYTSLKSYSTLMPPREADPEKNSYCIRAVPTPGFSEFLTFEDNIDCFKSPKTKECISYSKATSKSPVNNDGEDHENLVAGMPITKSANHKAQNDENADHEVQLQSHHCKDRSSPLILNHRARRRLQASKITSSNDIRPVDLDTTSVPNNLETREQVCFADQSTVAPIRPSCSRHPDPGEDKRPLRKRVRFLEVDTNSFQHKSAQKPRSGSRIRSNTRSGKRLKNSIPSSASRTQEEKVNVTSCRIRDRKRMIFQGLEFLLTGFSSKKECELEMIIRKHGGFIVSDVPPPSSLGRNRRFRRKFQQLPVLLAPKKLQTFKFLYGCAVNAFILNVSWLTDSIMAGCLLPPEKYMILPNQNSMTHKRIGRPVHCADLTYIFENLGVMLHGKHSFCADVGKIVKHGGGQVYKTLQWLVQSLKNGKISVGAIVTEDESSASRHLRQCASEQKLPMMPANWITESLLLRKLIPFKENRPAFPAATNKNADFSLAMEYSEEI